MSYWCQIVERDVDEHNTFIANIFKSPGLGLLTTLEASQDPVI